MTRPLVALAGVGAWGRHHLRNLRSMGCLGPVYDPSEEARSLIPVEHRAASFEDLLCGDGAESIVIATPARTHYRLALAALLAGKHVLVEKPLTLRVSEAEELVRLADERQRVLMVGHITLFHPALTKLRSLVQTGALGTLRYLYANRLNLGTVREEEDILWSFAPHDVAWLVCTLGQTPRRVDAVGGSYLRPGRADVTITHLEFEAGVKAHIFVSWLHPTKEHRLVVIGSDLMAVFEDGKDGGRLDLFRVDSARLERAGPAGIPDTVEFARAEPLRLELEHFLDCQRTGEEPRSGGRHGLAVLRVLAEAHQQLGRAQPALPREGDSPDHA